MSRRCRSLATLLVLLAAWAGPRAGLALTNVYLEGTPDYAWLWGCFGTASGNLMGYWDRHGFPNVYTGPTAGGVAPLNAVGVNSNIHALWASKAGVDGRAATNWGHTDDYYGSQYGDYQKTNDPYAIAGRPEHEPDCIGDFMGLSQYRWTNMAGECKGNLNAWVFNYWDTTGARRVNYLPGPEAGLPARDLQSGLAAFTEYRGYGCEVASQLADVWPDTPAGAGFTFTNLMAEIQAGHPVLLFLQKPWYADGSGNNPEIHGIMAYGYAVEADGDELARVMTSWGNGYQFVAWTNFLAFDGGWLEMYLRGVILYHPWPQLMRADREDGTALLEWHAPFTKMVDPNNSVVYTQQHYAVEVCTDLASQVFVPVYTNLFTNAVVVTNTPAHAVYRVRRTE